MIGDLEERGVSVTYRTLGIGYLSDAVHCISRSFQLTKTEAKNVAQKASKVALACLYHTFETLPVGTQTNLSSLIILLTYIK